MSHIHFILFLLGYLTMHPFATKAAGIDSLFAHYFNHAQTFADAYPREKVHLHFDNTSYYGGDTIWFKAYVVTAENNQPSTISTPLYVELIDQMGYTTNKQIIKLENGEGYGQIPLTEYVLSGYYEVRAYTKWMLAFNETQYFSRTFPIYRWLSDNHQKDRSIAMYNWDTSFRLRPREKKNKLSLHFFPEGGQLVQGITSVVAFKAESKDTINVCLSGEIQQNTNVTSFETLHEGMGYFMYTPAAEPSTAHVIWNDKKYSFKLPKALPAGYVLRVEKRGNQYEICVMRNEQTSRKDTVAVFFSHQGRPITYHIVKWENKNTNRFLLPTETLPTGIMQVSLINSRCETLCERFCYVMPQKNPLQLKVRSNTILYTPYAPIACHLSLKDSTGNPVKGKISVAIRDWEASDYMEYDNTLFTDLLLTSDLKGYIHQPGYYFADTSPQRLRKLDLLLLIHGWRKYDMPTAMGIKEFTPRYQPEKELTLHGQVLSIILKKAQPDMEVSILTRTDSLFAAGITYTDSTGYFNLPVMPFEETMEAIFQTHKPGKPRNRMCLVKLFRNFQPSLRILTYNELNPLWNNSNKLEWLARFNDSVYQDSVFGSDSHWISEVTIKAKKRQQDLNTIRFEQSVFAFYDVEQLLEEERDKGKDYITISDFLKDINSGIIKKYGGIEEFVNGKHDITWKDESINAVKYIIFCKGVGVHNMLQDKNFETGYSHMLDNYKYNDRDWTEQPHSEYGRWGVICNIITKDGWNPHLRYDYTRGIRYTTIKGYTHPLEFYSPKYLPSQPLPSNDRRRTLYWNPNIETDENGEATIHCFNASKSTFLTISAETIHDGQPASLNIHSIGLDEPKTDHLQ